MIFYIFHLNLYFFEKLFRKPVIAGLTRNLLIKKKIILGDCGSSPQ